MPGLVYVKRTTFSVENSGLPKPSGRRLVVAALAPDYRLPESAQVPAPCHSKSTRTVQSLSVQVPGVVISHSPAVSGRYIGSPSLALLPNGDYVASHDFFGPKADHTTAATTLVFYSKDRGKTWQQTAMVSPCFWGKLFVHREIIYLLGTNHEYGDVIIRRSEDGGSTWTVPNGPATGLLRRGHYHCAPCPTLIHNDRIWRSIEEFGGGNWGNFGTLVMSAPAGADLLAASSWRFSQPLPKQKDFCWLEGNVVLDPDGKVVNVLRTNDGGDDRVALVCVSDEGQELAFDRATGIIDMPGGGAKFTIRYDKRTSRYWSIANKQTDPVAYRNNLVLASSSNLRKWTVEKPLLHHAEAQRHAWQYVDWQFEGDDIVFASRTAFDDSLGGAHSAHDANYLTFHRVIDFRRLPGPDRLPSGHR
jgi:hypothetical protein